jgi:hypothetical protein
MINENKFELINEETKKTYIPRKVSKIKTLIINDCYGVPDKLKFGLTEGWDITKHYLILVDTEEGFTTLKTAFEDMFMIYNINTIDSNPNSGIGINDNLFSGKFTDEDIEYIPCFKKINSKPNKFVIKFPKQIITITTDPKEIYTKYDGNKNLTIDDIGFFSLRENNTDFAAQLKDYSTFINIAKEKKLKGTELLDWLYRNIMDGRFLYKPEITITEENQRNLTQTEKLAVSTNLKDFLNKDIPSMEDVVNNIHQKVFEQNATPIITSNAIEVDYEVENIEQN